MENTGILTTIAGIAMTFVGFTGLLITVRGGRGQGDWDPLQLYQLNVVIANGLTALFGSLGLVVLADLIGEPTGLRVAGIVVGLSSLVIGVRSARRVRAVFPEYRGSDRVPFTVVSIAAIAVLLAVGLFPARALYELGLLLLLATPALVFRFVMANLGPRKD